MIRSAIEFFTTLDEKTCEHCGEAIVEQADCYSCSCSKCDPFQAHEAFTKSETKQAQA
ncbi:hypothetical protein D3C86_1955250 [compost metagenome]